MPGRWQIAWFLLGFAAAVVLGVALEPAPARAQGTARSITAITPPPARQEVLPRRGGAAVLPRDTESTPLRPSIPAPVPAGAEEESDEEPQDGDPVEVGDVRAGQRRVPLDGDATYPRLPEPLRDGISDEAEPGQPQDGADATRFDNRSPEDVSIFEQPPAGFDPLLFQVEIEPILDRRPARLFRFEPYEATGIRVGSFILLPELDTSAVWLSNVLRATKARSATALDVRPSARLVSNWRQHALEFRAAGSATFLNEFSSEEDRAWIVETRGRIDLSRRTNIEALASREVTQESRSALDAAASAADRSDITTDRLAVALNHRFNRLSLQLRGGVSDVSYGRVVDAVTGLGIDNRDRNYRTSEEALRASWELKPTLFAFAEIALNQRAYEAAALSDGIRRDSTGVRYRAGVSFGNTGQKLRGEAAVGYGIQRPDDARLGDIEGFIFDANLAYRMSGLTTFLLSARSDVAETTLAGSGGAWSRQVGLDVRHAFMRSLIGTAGMSVTTTDYAGADLDETEVRSTLALEYSMNRNVTIYGRYQHTAFTSTQAGRDYDADEVRVGLRLRQ